MRRRLDLFAYRRTQALGIAQGKPEPDMGIQQQEASGSL